MSTMQKGSLAEQICIYIDVVFLCEMIRRAVGSSLNNVLPPSHLPLHPPELTSSTWTRPPHGRLDLYVPLVEIQNGNLIVQRSGAFTETYN